ncbi:uncharacterized protein K489DRAFT_140530 [Dissoconium aciculare CBS 342.82]|uniref:Uncharacterized protein n=1 Tax=Dissoconium aciculare CBS 342.82 TaxID=1314786 RepID=A0A6J3LPM4_9PEZI|nr:uncharacterized protein K489DRAFT_140530 [Dissoconium aciculare CBS 342.82]KAF1817825.1 hypothetical protein K489DRAFT_140530 [Dissoconium aciculare CBS 342.82]
MTTSEGVIPRQTSTLCMPSTWRDLSNSQKQCIADQIRPREAQHACDDVDCRDAIAAPVPLRISTIRFSHVVSALAYPRRRSKHHGKATPSSPHAGILSRACKESISRCGWLSMTHPKVHLRSDSEGRTTARDSKSNTPHLSLTLCLPICTCFNSHGHLHRAREHYALFEQVNRARPMWFSTWGRWSRIVVEH